MATPTFIEEDRQIIHELARLRWKAMTRMLCYVQPMSYEPDDQSRELARIWSDFDDHIDACLEDMKRVLEVSEEK